MAQYVVIDGEVFNIYESKGRFVIKINSLKLDIEKSIDLLSKLLIENRDSYINSLIDKELPVCWIKKEYIQDCEFVATYYPEFLL